MCDNRVVLVAKRKNDRICTSSASKSGEMGHNEKRGTKRPLPVSNTPKKNLANDRLKRLRTTLQEDVRRASSDTSQNLVRTPRKRSQDNTQNEPQIPQKSSRNIKHVEGNSSTKSANANNFLAPSKHNVNDVKQLDSSFRFDSQSESMTSNTFCAQTPVVPFASDINISLNSCVVNANPSEPEEMEWDTFDVNPRASGISSTTSSKTEVASSSKTAIPCNLNNTNILCIVVDTNIFIRKLTLIKTIIEMKMTDGKDPIILIPWMVFEELDFIKEDKNRGNDLKWKAQEAIKFINNALINKKHKIRGETLDEVNAQKDTGNNQDNKIIACCLQMFKMYQNVLLLTNDINLRNKAQINNIPAFSDADILSKLNKIKGKKKSEIILEKMTMLCSSVIRKSARKEFGQTFDNMHLAKIKPQSLQECIKIFKKYWISLFQHVLMKTFKHRIEDLYKFLQEHESINDGSSDLPELLRRCVRICIYLKDVEDCKCAVETTIRELNNVTES